MTTAAQSCSHTNLLPATPPPLPTCLPACPAVGGAAPKIVHYTRHKPFHGRREGELGHEFLCPSDELHRRSIMAGQMLAPNADAAAGGGAAAAGAGSGGPEGQAAPAWGAATAGAQQPVLEQAQRQQQTAAHQEQAVEEQLGDDAVQEQAAAAADPEAEQQQQQLQQQQQQQLDAGNVETAVEPLEPTQQQAASQQRQQQSQQQALAVPGPDAADGQLLAARAALSQHGGKELPGIK